MRTFCSLWLIVGSGISMIHSLILISGFTCKTFVKCLIPIAPIVSTFDAFSFTAAFGSALVYFFVPVKLAWTAWEEQCKSCRYNSTVLITTVYGILRKLYYIVLALIVKTGHKGVSGCSLVRSPSI
ncbi:Hypothetical predicted protein [Cloeon dipterum]|uniref:Uncharacterized protein n=1 Tax=Cloeon dipterum TaxID=197152 RepID=A0A8S1D159_9INSE|nr:Hypothetical predicted protein [Cloeon dipterum]